MKTRNAHLGRDVEAYIRAHADKQGVFVLPGGTEGLARTLGATRHTIADTLGRLARRGVIEKVLTNDQELQRRKTYRTMPAPPALRYQANWYIVRLTQSAAASIRRDDERRPESQDSRALLLNFVTRQRKLMEALEDVLTEPDRPCGHEPELARLREIERRYGIIVGAVER